MFETSFLSSESLKELPILKGNQLSRETSLFKQSAIHLMNRLIE